MDIEKDLTLQLCNKIEVFTDNAFLEGLKLKGYDIPRSSLHSFVKEHCVSEKSYKNNTTTYYVLGKPFMYKYNTKELPAFIDDKEFKVSAGLTFRYL